jgi:hypothetical protein
MSRPRALAIVFTIEALALALVALVALDLYAHKRVDNLAGLNIWGYRGSVAHQKQPGEIRIAVVGGTRAFGLGMAAPWTIATVMRQQVMLVTDVRGGALHQVVPLTLAQPGALPDSYVATIEHYAYLRPDYICIYDDLGVGGAALPDEQSGLYAHTGYWPALPLTMQEKGMAWRFGSVRAGYATREVAPERSWPGRAAGALLQAAGDGLSRLDRAMARPRAHHTDDPQHYSLDLMRAVDAALAHTRGVVIALAPAESARQAANLAAVWPLLEARRRTTPELRVLNLAGETMLTDMSQRLDDWNYGGDAIAAAAKAVTPAMLELIAR